MMDGQSVLVAFAVFGNLLSWHLHRRAVRRLVEREGAWEAVGEVRVVPGEGRKLMTTFKDVPPVGTVFYVRRVEVKRAL